MPVHVVASYPGTPASAMVGSSGNAGERVGRHQHVGVSQHDPVVTRCFPALDAIVELGIGADAVVADQQPGRHFWKAANGGTDQPDHWVVSMSDAEDQLVAGPV